MRTSLLVLVALSVACSSKATQVQPEPPGPPPAKPAASAAVSEPAAPASAAEVMAADTPRATVAGNTFVAPSGWSVAVRGPATILTPPESASRIVLTDLQAKSADEAMALAWKSYRPAGPIPPLKVAVDVPDKEGWTRGRTYEYQISPNEKRIVGGAARYANEMWSVAIIDVEIAVAEKRGSQLGLIFGKFLPKGHERESFKGKKANPLDAGRVAALAKFIEDGQQQLGVPGVSIGLVQDGKVVFAGGFGVRKLGDKAKVGADTRYMIASNTKALTTLMLAKLADEKKLGWDTAATALLPSFKLGDADTTSRVQVKHLICACTGLPRQDMEWILEFGGMTPEKTMAMLGTMQPTSKFGELFQYSNLMAAAAGFIGGHVAFPKLELGRAYDEAMRTRVFAPLGMKATTFDYKAARKGDFAAAHGIDVDGNTALAVTAVNEAILPARPAGAAWSTVNDVLKYVQMELLEGKLPSGKTYVSRENLLARREPQVTVSENITYGMGLMVDARYGVAVVHHGGDLIGYHSDMMWLPEVGVGAVILTNADTGAVIRGLFMRKLLEVLFDGKPEADAQIAAAAKNLHESIAAERKLLTVPADAAEAAKLAPRYANASLGEVAVRHEGAQTVFDFGEFKSEVASRHNPDQTVSFLTITPGLGDIELVVGGGEAGKRTLVLRDAQHEYVFEEKAPK